MKKQIFIFTIISIFLPILNSCEDYLKEEHVSGIGFSYYDNENGIEDLLRSAYVPLRTWGGTELGLRLSNSGTDIWEFSEVTSGREFQLYTSDLNSSNGNFIGIWSAFYRGINRCNIVINRIPDIKDASGFLRNDEGKNKRIGEAKFLRGYYYFMLVQMYGRIPLLLDENIGVLTDISRSEVSYIYNVIISDLRFAAQYLPEIQSEQARPTQSAANQLLAKVYLTRGIAEIEKRGKKPTDMDSAAYYAENVINFKGDLLIDYHDVRRVDNENNKEVIFAVQYTTNELYNGGGNNSHLFFQANYIEYPGLAMDLAYGRIWARVKPTDYLFSLYDLKNDSRFYKQYQTVWYCNHTANIPTWTEKNAPSPDLIGQKKFGIGDTALYITMNVVESESEIGSKPYGWVPRNKWRKWIYPSYRYHLDPYRSSVATTVGTREFVLMWYSESFLIAAEAYGRKGDYNKAVEYINAVRRRAAYKEGEEKPKQFYTTDGGNYTDLFKSTESTMEITVNEINSPQKLRDFILEERAREFVGDYERFFDLVRTETFYDRITLYNKLAVVNVKPWHKLRPIPQEHIDLISNPGTHEEEQNEGY